MSNVTPFQRPAHLSALDEADTLGSCLQAVRDLVSPDLSLSFHERDHLAVLLGLLLEQQQRAIDTIRESISKGK